MNQDAQQLELLKVFHFVLAAMQGLAGCIPLLQIALGLAVLDSMPLRHDRNAPSEAFGWLFLGVAVFLMALIWAMAALTYVAGRRLAERRSHMFCMVVAAVLCVVFMPLGTLLGVFTIIVLQRPSVKALFAT